MAFFGKYMAETYQRLTRVETKVDSLQSDVEEIKGSVRGIKKMIVIVAASSSLLGNADLGAITEMVANHFKGNESISVKDFNQIDNTYTIKTKALAKYDDSTEFTID
jgi:hypothetical protein